MNNPMSYFACGCRSNNLNRRPPRENQALPALPRAAIEQLRNGAGIAAIKTCAKQAG